MANSSLTVGELPAIDDVSVCVCVCGGGEGGGGVVLHMCNYLIDTIRGYV